MTAIVACTLAASGAAATAGTEVLRTAFTDVHLNPCVDELVETTGTLHVVRHTTTTQNGTTNTFSASFTDMNATGLTSRDRYVVTHVDNASSHTSSSTVPMEFTHSETLVLNRLGEDGAPTDDDYLLHALTHGTVSASGVVTIKELEFKPECR